MAKKRIGIVTIVKAYNFGAELQAYALQAVLKGMGHAAETILLDEGEQHAAKPKYTWKFRLVRIVVGVVERFRRRKRHLVEHRFTRFWDEAMSFSNQCYWSVDQIDAECPYQVLVAGSDQIWNPNKGHNVDFFFLNFGPPAIRRFAYAASFGVLDLSEAQRDRYRDALKCFDALGIRESSGLELLEQIGIDSGVQVLDPTLLLSASQWEQVEQYSECAMPEEEYVLVYVLKRSAYALELAEQIAADRGLRLVQINNTLYNRSRSADVLNTVGPADFVKLFLNASFVVTNSFHGLAFSVNFGRPFYSVVKSDDPNRCRMESLAEELGVRDRILYQDQPTVLDFDLLVDWKSVNQKLNQQRSKSIRFLSAALDD